MNQGPKSSLNTALRFLETSSSLFHDLISNIHSQFHPEGADRSKQGINYWGLVHHAYSNPSVYKNGRASFAAYWQRP